MKAKEYINHNDLPNPKFVIGGEDYTLEQILEDYAKQLIKPLISQYKGKLDIAKHWNTTVLTDSYKYIIKDLENTIKQ